MDDLVLIGDRVLVAPDAGEARTATGLILPASVRDGERVGTGRVVAVGPGYLTANPDFSGDDEPWRDARPAVRYLPLQAQAGDFAFFPRKDAVEITFRDVAYLILPHAALLALSRTPAPDPDDLLRGLFGEGG